MGDSKEHIKFAVVGLGHIGWRHVEMIRRNRHAEIVALCDIRNQNEFPAEKIGGINFYSDLSEMLNAESEIDVVVIATPNGLHAQQALMCLDHKKHVVIEKPMALNTADAEEVIYKALNVSRQVFTVMQNRYSPPSKWIKSVLDQGVLGEIYMVDIKCFWNRDERYYGRGTWHGKQDLDGGTLFTQFSHFVDMIYWLFGDVTNIQARFRDFNHSQLTDFEDSGLVTFDFVKGGVGNLSYSTSVYDRNMESSMTIVAEKGSVKIGGQYMNEIEYCHIQDYEMPELPPSNPANDYGAYKGSAANHAFVIENVVDTLRGETSITTNALEGLKVVGIIERIYALK
jgi:predicted dehydrogenase